MPTNHPQPRTLGQLFGACSGAGVEAVPASARETRITGIADDSREIQPGFVFVARAGTDRDGSAFIADAIAAGAAAIVAGPEGADAPAGVPVVIVDSPGALLAPLAEAFHGHPSGGLFIAGVTGTNGKSTIVHLASQLLTSCGIPCGRIGTVDIFDGDRSRPASLTTPGSCTISGALAAMRGNGLRAAILETSSHALDQGRVAAIDFDAAVFTNLTGDHQDYHGDLDAYAAAKARLFTRLGAEGSALINTDDGHAGVMLEACSGPALRCSATDAGADIRVEVLSEDLHGLDVRIHTPHGVIEARSPLIGRHNAMNIAQAVGVAQLAGASLEAISAALPTLGAPPGRLEPVRVAGAEDAPLVLVDYAHTDDALASMLGALRPLAEREGRRLLLVFGCGGDRDRSKRPRMARAALDGADEIILTSDNPRSEDPLAIIEEALAGANPLERGRISVEADRAKAIELAIGGAGPRDLVVIAGKGHEDYQLVPDAAGGVIRRSFDDRVVARGVIERRYSCGRTPSGPAEGDAFA